MDRKQVIKTMLIDVGFVGLLVGLPFGGFLLFVYYLIHLFPYPLNVQLMWLFGEIQILIVLSYTLTDIYCELRES